MELWHFNKGLDGIRPYYAPKKETSFFDIRHVAAPWFPYPESPMYDAWDNMLQLIEYTYIDQTCYVSLIGPPVNTCIDYIGNNYVFTFKIVG